MELERADNTIDTYMRTLDIFYGQYGAVTKMNMIDFKNRQMEKWTPKTANLRIAAMNQYCKFINQPECCIKGIKMQQNTAVENVITIDEFRTLLSGLKEDGNEKGYWIIKFIAKTGARISELIRMTKSGLKNGYCEMWTKGKIRRIYIPASLIEESREYFQKSDSELLFTNKYGKQYTTKGVDTNIKKWAEKYGIRKEVAHAHAFRHLYAIEFLKRNSNISLLADLMGHSSVNTTAIYLKLSKEEQMKQLNMASDW